MDGAGNSYVTGRFAGSATFGAGETNETTLTSAGGDIFVAKYDAAGDLVWAKGVDGTDFDAGNGIAVDGAGNSYVTGSFRGSATFGAGETNEITLTSAGSRDIFVAKYARASGSITIAKHATPADDTSFGFTSTIPGGGSFTLMAPSDDTETFVSVTPGSYDVTETVPMDWTLESIVCTGDTDIGSVVDLGNNQVTIDLDPDEQITCTFSNIATAGIPTPPALPFQILGITNIASDG